MANLLYKNIGTNYKGILNLDATTINTPLDATLRAVTDGMGTSSPFSISTAQAAIGTYTAASYASAKLIVGNYASANSEVANIGIMAVSQATLNSATAYGYAVYGHGYTNGSARSGGVVGEGKVTVTGDTGSAIGVRGYANDTHAGGFNIGLYGDATGGSSNYALYMAAGDIYSAVSQNWAFNTATTLSLGIGTVTSNGFLTVKGGGANILSLRDSSNVEQFSVSNIGTTRFGTYLELRGNGANFNVYQGGGGVGMSFYNNNMGTLLLTLNDNSAGGCTIFTTKFNFGGTTSSFPAIKRNGAAIDFRLADDSGYCDTNSRYLFLYGDVIQGSGGSRFDLRAQYDLSFQCGRAAGTGGFSFGTSNFSAASSAIIEIQSTTKGFLPPRMTTTQKNAISTPATGLVVFDTTLVKLAVYNGSAWETVTSV